MLQLLLEQHDFVFCDFYHLIDQKLLLSDDLIVGNDFADQGQQVDVCHRFESNLMRNLDHLEDQGLKRGFFFVAFSGFLFVGFSDLLLLFFFGLSGLSSGLFRCHICVIRNMRNDLVEMIHAKYVHHLGQKIKDYVEMEHLGVSISLLIDKVVREIANDPLSECLLKLSIIICLEVWIEREIQAQALCDLEHISRFGQDVNMQIPFGQLHQA